MSTARPLTLALALCVTGGCKGCREPDDEAAILALIGEAAVMAQEHDPAGLMDMTTKWFTASPGDRDRRQVRQILALAFQRYGTFRIAYPEPAIDVAPDRASARVEVPFVVLREGLTLPDLGGLAGDPEGWIEKASMTADPYVLDLWLVREDGEWLVDRAKIGGLRSIEPM